MRVSTEDQAREGFSLPEQENDKFYFKYILENVKEAEKCGVNLLIAFQSLNAIYEIHNYLQYLVAGYQMKIDQKLKRFKKLME